MGGLAGLRAGAAALSSAVVTAAATAAWAAPVAAEPTPIPVKADPVLIEAAPVSSGPWFVWSRSLEKSFDSRLRGKLFVQRAGQSRIMVNERSRKAFSGAIAGKHVIYAQQRGLKKARLFAYDLRTGRRHALPDRVSFAKWRGLPTRLLGDVSAHGPWVLFSRVWVEDEIALEQMVVYNRVTRDLRVLATVDASWGGRLKAGQANDPWVTYAERQAYTGDEYLTEVVRHNVRSGRTTIVDDGETGDDWEDLVNVVAPAVTPGGTFYYWRSTRDSVSGEGSTWQTDLVRRPRGGPTEVVASLPGAEPYYIDDTFVRERADGSKRVFYSYRGDIFRLDL